MHPPHPPLPRQGRIISKRDLELPVGGLQLRAAGTDTGVSFKDGRENRRGIFDQNGVIVQEKQIVSGRYAFTRVASGGKPPVLIRNDQLYPGKFRRKKFGAPVG